MRIGVDEIDHLLPQNPYDRKAILADPTEMAKLKRKSREAQRHREEQQQATANNSATWDAWCDARIGHAIFDKDGCLHHTFAQLIAHQRAEHRDELGAGLDKLRGELNKLHEELRLKLGRPPQVKRWKAGTVFYLGDIVTHSGNTFQAQCDTCQPTDHPDWILLAARGLDGLDAPMLNFRGAFDVDEKYAKLDVIEYAGGAFVATRDNPAIIPGEDGWQVLALPGGRGPEGPIGAQGRKGERGPPGRDTPRIIDWVIDKTHYAAHPIMSDGRPGPVLQLRDLFQQFLSEGAIDAVVDEAMRDAARTAKLPGSL